MTPGPVVSQPHAAAPFSNNIFLTNRTNRCLDLGSIGLLLEVIQKNRKGAGLFTEIGDDGAGRANGLLDGTVVVKLGESAPGTEVLSGFDHDNVDLTLGTESLDELLVFLVLTVLGEATQTGAAAIECLGALVESLLQSSVDHGLFQDLTESIQDTHLGDFLDGSYFFGIRHGIGLFGC